MNKFVIARYLVNYSQWEIDKVCQYFDQVSYIGNNTFTLKETKYKFTLLSYVVYIDTSFTDKAIARSCRDFRDVREIVAIEIILYYARYWRE